MIKKLLVLLAVVAVLWSIPATRSRIVLVSAPLLEKLGPVGEKIITPARRYRARTTAALYLSLIAQGYNEGREPPSQRDFPRWVKARTDGDGLDPWGRPYWIYRERGRLSIGSNGPDGVRGTPDDITQTVPF